MKRGFITDIEKATEENTDYRRVLYTGQYSQLVVMCLQPGEEIGAEVHEGIDQFIRVEEGVAKVILNGSEEHTLPNDHAVIIPSGVEHNVINVGDESLKLYSIYSPPEHKEGTVHPTKADETHEHFDGTTTE